MAYEHRWSNGTAITDLPVGKVVCVGRNYAEHARELNNHVPTTPLLFIKPASAITPMQEALSIPHDQGAVHYETELALLIDRPLSQAGENDAQKAICGIGLGLDLTLRDVQNQLKELGHPWERAKGFDGACPLSPFLPIEAFADLTQIPLSLEINGQLKQTGNSCQMITPIIPLLCHISEHFSLAPGDVVLTGTPAGVGPLHPGDHITLEIPGKIRVETRVN